MRMALPVFAGALVASFVLTAPALAKNSTPQKDEDKSTSSSSCSAYQQAPDGSWQQLPCKETGERSQPQTSKSPARKAAIRASAERRTSSRVLDMIKDGPRRS